MTDPTDEQVNEAVRAYIQAGKRGLDLQGAMRDAIAAAQATPTVALQPRVHPWLMACFGPEISADRQERNHRFLEEALELVQACGATADEAHQLVDYVFGRPAGERAQEVGGVMITLAALCLAQGFDMHAAGEAELTRIWTMVEKIRAKQAAKPKHSPLAASQPPSATQSKRVMGASELLALAGPFWYVKERTRNFDAVGFAYAVLAAHCGFEPDPPHAPELSAQSAEAEREAFDAWMVGMNDRGWKRTSEACWQAWQERASRSNGGTRPAEWAGHSDDGEST